MLFKVRSRKAIGADWWLEDNCRITQEESEAFVFDSNNEDHMQNVNNDYLKVYHTIKIVTPREEI